MHEAPVLRPLSVGDIIDRMFRLFRENPILFLGIAVIPTLVSNVLARAVGLTQTFDLNDFGAAFSNPGASPAFRQLNPVNPGAATAVGIVAVVLGITQAGALTYAIGQRYLGRPETVPDAFARGIRALPRVFLCGVALAFALGLVVIVFAIALGVFTALSLAAVAVILGIAGFFFVLPWAFLSVAVVLPAIVFEGLGPIAAIRRSFQLMDKARLRTLGLYVLTIIIYIILSLVFSVVFLASFVAEPTARAVLQTVADVASASIGGTLLSGVVVILYYDLRVRKEAFDLQLAAEALPREG